jgi:hypothetical protein
MLKDWAVSQTPSNTSNNPQQPEAATETSSTSGGVNFLG